MARQRDYKAEYQRRVRSGMARGLTRKQARGFHAAERRKMPDGGRADVITASELRQGRLRVATIETMHNVNRGMNGKNSAAWVAFARSLGWSVSTSPRGHFYTQDNVASAVLERMTWRERDYFFGY